MANQGGYRQSNPRSGGNQGWNIDHDDCWRDRDREGRDRGTNSRDRDGDKDHYVPPHKCQKAKEPKTDLENFYIEDMFALILNKVEGLDKVIKEMKDLFAITSYSIPLRNLKRIWVKISAHLNPKTKVGIPNDTLVNLDNEA